MPCIAWYIIANIHHICVSQRVEICDTNAPCPIFHLRSKSLGTNQALELVVRQPQLLQGARHRLQALDLADEVACQRERLERRHAIQPADLLDAVGRQRQLPAGWKESHIRSNNIS